MAKWRSFIKKSLLKIASSIEEKPKDEKVIRGYGSFFKREIHLPAYLVFAVCLAVFLGVLILEIGISLPKIIGLSILLSIIFAFFVLYVTKVEKNLSQDSESVALLGLIFISAAVLMYFFKNWFSPIAVPIAAFSILAGLLLSRRIAIITGIVLSLIISVLNNFGLEYFLIHSFSSFTGIVFLSEVRNRFDVAKIGFFVAFSNLITILIIFLFGLWPVKSLLVSLGWGVAGGAFSALLVLILLPFLEIFFSKITNIKLLELADFNQRLLKKLMVEAPGTYHHSLTMASIAEQAAESIGANSLLARVGAYYHDVGKLSHPEYFIENQSNIKNPHDLLTPAMSSLIVGSHVKEGIAIAKKYKLNKVIIDAIAEHHGTSLMQYFYHRALEQSSDIDPEKFRYPGPKPKSKVTAILMIADAAEAASRAIEDPSPGKLKDVVEKVINNKFTDGQFAECPITLHDLNTIADAVVTALGGIYHARVEYQEIEKEKS